VSEEPPPFELEEEPEPEKKAPAPEKRNGDPADEPPSETEVRATPPRQTGHSRPRHPDEPEIDERTFAEKHGRAVERVVGRRPPPPGWPLEALRYPLRTPGLRMIAGGAALLVALDVVTWANLFLGWFLKVLVLPFLVRWQLHAASMSAAGRDEPARWLDAVEMLPEHALAIRRFFIALPVLLVPGAIAAALGNLPLAVVLFLLGSVWLAVVALGAAVADPALLWPWQAAGWIASRPLGLLVAAAGWWAAGFVEVCVALLETAPFATALPLFVLLRIPFFYVWMLSARVLGVVGREWTPWGAEPGEGGAA
jgi:hypothetical protein